MNLNPLIAEITSNPAIPVYKTAWYKNKVRAMVKSGKTAYVIAQQLNKTLRKLPKHIWVRQAKARIGPLGTAGRERKDILTPNKVYRSILGSKDRRGIMPGAARHKLLDPRMLRGRAAKLYQQTKSMPKVVAQLRTAFKKIKGQRTAPYTKPSTRAAMKKFPKITKRKSNWSKLSPKEKKAWVAKMQRAKRKKAKGKTKSKAKYSPKSKKRSRVSQQVGAKAGGKNIAAFDVLNSMDELDLATLPLEEFNDIAAMADAINPMIRMPNIQGLLTKLGNIALGKVPGAYGLKAADWLAEKITFLLPSGTIKNIVTEFLADGAIYGIAEAFIPYRYATIQQSIQDVAVLKFLSNIHLGPFSLIPAGLFGMRPMIGSPAVSQGYHYSDLDSPHDEILAVVDDSILGGAVERELTEEEVGQLLSLEQADPSQRKYAPQQSVHQDPQPEAVSSQEANNQ